VGSVCHVKRLHLGGKRFADDEKVETVVQKWLRQMYQCWCRKSREINIFSRFEYHMFYILYTFVTYLLTLPCTSVEHYC
jgi:hypothetical protein